ncbi:MAG TPA: hypothetical protein VEI52_05695 [Terriglobales bacterium]|nr:hypothetical protein [Terriglobales bacterium]
MTAYGGFSSADSLSPRFGTMLRTDGALPAVVAHGMVAMAGEAIETAISDLRTQVTLARLRPLSHLSDLPGAYTG